MPAVTKKGQVTIPKNFRDKLGISEGDQVSFALSGDGSILIRKEQRFSILSLAGIASGRAIGSGDERAWAKQSMAKRIVRGV
jgi:AbrB family looped-hinge helix DNA binding protein